MTTLITTADVSKTIQQIAATCAMKADALDKAWLAKADPRAVQGGDTCEAAAEWRLLSTQLKRLALGATELAD